MYAFPTEYRRYIRYRRAVLRFVGNTVLGFCTLVMCLTLIAFFASWAGLIKVEL
jgi:hypothetical protein